MKHNILLIASIAVLSLMSCKKEQAVKVESHEYPTIIVEPADRTLNSDFPATITGKQTVEIRPQIDGVITKICIGEGDAVHQGQVLFEIDPAQFQAAYDIAQANVNSAEAGVSTAELVYASNKELYQEKVISDFELNTAKNELDEAKAKLKLAKAELEKAATNLGYTKVKSPVNGVASMIPYRVGALVNPNISNPLVTVSDDAEVYAYFSMSENGMLDLAGEYGSIEKAIQKMPDVEFKMSNGQVYPHKGHIDAVSGTINNTTGAVSFRAVFLNNDRILRDGSTGMVVIPTNYEDCIVIPQTATYELQDKVFVFKVIDGVAKSAEIKVLPQSNGTEYVVVEGLAQGDEIISEGAGLVKEGTEIKKKNAEEK